MFVCVCVCACEFSVYLRIQACISEYVGCLIWGFSRVSQYVYVYMYTYYYYYDSIEIVVGPFDPAIYLSAE